ncbi:ATP-grasp domain-containing protein [Cytobacillus sp. FJAT-54145]|uniref:ATP-grasp domain-containing protein n=1 Tax=Cytobacillus spartinae TaxID=3299023 RepID=A0ABW6K4Z3_9BACI
MNTIVFIGSYKSGTSREALLCAKEMGYYVTLFTEKSSYKDSDFPEVDCLIYKKQLLEKDQILSSLAVLTSSGKQISACLSFIDPYVSFAASIAEELGLNRLSINSLKLMEDKLKFREVLKDSSVSPFYTVYKDGSSKKEFVKRYKDRLPLIVKPPISHGSRDVMLAKTRLQLRSTIKELAKKYPETSLLIEEYLNGPQYLIEVMVYKGEVKIAGVVEQEFSKENEFIITGYSYPADLKDEDYKALRESIISIAEKLNLKDGACHLEMRNTDGQWKLVEVNPRMAGGVMNKIIIEGTDINLVKEILKLHLGEEPKIEPKVNQYVHAKFLTVNTYGKLLEITGESSALDHKGVKYVYIKPQSGAIISTPRTMGNRYGCIVAVGDTLDEAKDNAKSAAMEIKFFIDST